MSFDFDPIYLIWLLVAASAGLGVEAVYLLCFKATSYRSQINRRLMLSKDKKDRESVLIQLRRERGLTGSGNYRLYFQALNRLILQSGVTIGFGRLAIVAGFIGAVAGVAMFVFSGNPVYAGMAAFLGATVLPYLVLRLLRARRQGRFGAQFPDALDIIVRSLRAGHPVPIAINMVGREMPDPIGSEFGMVSDEITYGADLETAMRNLYCRIGSDDLPLFVTAVGIQGSTGGNLGEILEQSLLRDPAALQDAAENSRARFGRPRLGDDPVGVADRHVHGGPGGGAGFLRGGLARTAHEDPARLRCDLDAGRQPHHVQDGQLQDLTDGRNRRLWHVGRQRGDDAEPADFPRRRHACLCGDDRHARARCRAATRGHRRR